MGGRHNHATLRLHQNHAAGAMTSVMMVMFMVLMMVMVHVMNMMYLVVMVLGGRHTLA